MPETSSPTLPPTPSVLSEGPEIHVIPEKFYGAALKAKIPEPGQKTGAMNQPAASHTGLVVVLVLLLLVVIGGGTGVYLFRDRLFPKQQTPPVTQKPPDIPPPVTAPEAPSGLAVTSTNPQTTSLSWIDNASSESGFRIDRAEGDGAFSELTGLPPNSTSYVDASVQPGRTVRSGGMVFA
jgi:hypothetical protein